MTQQLAEKLTYKRTVITDSLTLGKGETTSSLLDCGGIQVRGFLFPSNWTSCNITLQGAIVDNATLTYTISNIDGDSLSIATSAGQWLPLLPWVTDAVPYLQIGCSVQQESESNIIVVLEPLYQGIHG